MKNILLIFFVLAVVGGFAFAERGGSGNSNNSTTECVINDDCDADEICIDGECEDNDLGNRSSENECTADTDCTNGKVCINGECERFENETEDNDKNETEDECSVNTDCDADKVCLNGECEDADENETEDNDENETDDNSTGRVRWLKDCVDDSAMRNLNELAMKLRQAEVRGDQEEIIELKAQIEKLNLKVRTRTEECKQRNMNLGLFVSQAVKDKNGSASGIVEYYKLKLSEISQEDNLTLRLDMLRALRQEVDAEIRSIMENKREIRQEEMKDLVEKFEIRRDKIKADDVEVDSDNRTIITEINGKEVEIKVLNRQIKIKVEGTEVDASEITLENNTLFYNGTAIKTLPSDALFRYKIKAKEMELEQKEDRLIYKVKYEQRKKVLGLFKAKAQREAEIDSSDGNKLEDKGPWWIFLATNDKSVETAE